MEVYLIKLLIPVLFFLLSPAANAQDRNKNSTDSLISIFNNYTDRESVKIINTGKILLSQPLSNKQKFEIAFRMSGAYLDDIRPNPDKSTEMLFLAKSFAEKSNSPELLAKIYGSIANQYSYLNFTEKILYYLQKSRQQIDRLPDGDLKFSLSALYFIEMGNLDSDQKKFVRAKVHYQNSLQQIGKISTPEYFSEYHYQRALYNLGNSYFNLNQPDSAKFYYNQALRVMNHQNTNLKYFIYFALSKIYTQQGDNQRSIDTLLVVLNDESFNDERLKSDIFYQLAQNYKATGDKEKYILYTEKHLQINPNVRQTEMKAISTAVTAEQESYLADITRSKTRSRMLAGGIILLLISSGAVILSLSRKRNRERNIYLGILKELEEKQGNNPSQKLQSSNGVNTQMSNETTPDMKLQMKSHNEDDPKEPALSSGIPAGAETDVLAKLDKFELTHKYINQKLTVASVAVQLKTNPTYLTETIKKHKGKNFNAYINDLRIRYICEMIHTHPEYLNYKISYLAEQCGFQSHSSFTTVFKSVTGISPSAFLREAIRRNSANTISR